MPPLPPPPPPEPDPLPEPELDEDPLPDELALPLLLDELELTERAEEFELLELDVPLLNPLDRVDLEPLLEIPLELDGLTLEEDLEEVFLLKDTPLVLLLLEVRPALKAGLLREVLEATAFLPLLLEVVATLEEERLEFLESLNL